MREALKSQRLQTLADFQQAVETADIDKILQVSLVIPDTPNPNAMRRGVLAIPDMRNPNAVRRGAFGRGLS